MRAHQVLCQLLVIFTIVTNKNHGKSLCIRRGIYLYIHVHEYKLLSSLIHTFTLFLVNEYPKKCIYPITHALYYQNDSMIIMVMMSVLFPLLFSNRHDFYFWNITVKTSSFFLRHFMEIVLPKEMHERREYQFPMRE